MNQKTLMGFLELENSKILMYAFSKQIDGNMSVKSGIEGEKNRNIFVENKFGKKNLIISQVVHGDNIEFIESVSGKKEDVIFNCDGLITSLYNTAIGVTFADCPPVLFWDRFGRGIGIAHGSWKCTYFRIHQKIVEMMEQKCKCLREDLKIFIGPGICTRHYEFGKSLAELKFPFCRKYIKSHVDPEKCFLNLNGIISNQLIKSGIKSENIHISNFPKFCTYENINLFSRRRDGAINPSSGMAILMLSS